MWENTDIPKINQISVILLLFSAELKQPHCIGCRETSAILVLIWHYFPLDVPCFDFKSFYTVFCLFLCLTINWSGSKQVQIQLKGSNPAKKALGSRLKLSYRSTMSKSTGLWWICHLWRSLSQLNSQGGWKEVKNVKQIFLLSKVC